MTVALFGVSNKKFNAVKWLTSRKHLRVSGQAPGRQACVGWPSGLQGLTWDRISQHCLTLICWSFRIIANSRPVISASFFSHPPPPPSPLSPPLPTLGQISMGCGKYSTLYSLGCHGYLQGNAALCTSGPSTYKASTPKLILLVSLIHHTFL